MAIELTPLTDRILNLLQDRGIEGETAARLGWQTCAGRKGDWVAIPFYRNGKVVNHKYKRLIKSADEANYSQDKGGEQCFYNLAAIEEISALKADEQAKRQLVVTEGEMDCAIAIQCGYMAVSVPNGAPDKPIEEEDAVKFDFLKDFPRTPIAILAVDNDAPGVILRSELAQRLGWHRCKWVQYPKGCKDLNDVFMKYGKKGVDMVLQQKSRFMNEGGLFLMSELPETPDIYAYDCPIPSLEENIKFRLGDVSVVTGIPSMGKTTVVNTMACLMARDNGWKVCFGSFEQNPRTDHQRWLRTFFLDKPARDEQGYNNWTTADIAGADAWIDNHFTFIVPDVNTDDLITLKWVISRVRAAITQYGSNMVIIDPWNELDHDRPHGMSLTEYTGYAIKEFKRIAKQYMVHICIVAHPSKMEKNKEGGYSVPTLYDISDSAHWANKCDLGIVVHLLEGEEKGKYGTLVRVAKVRYWGIIGKRGDRILEYMPNRGKFLPYPDFKPKSKKEPNKAKTVHEDKKGGKAKEPADLFEDKK